MQAKLKEGLAQKVEVKKNEIQMLKRDQTQFQKKQNLIKAANMFRK